MLQRVLEPEVMDSALDAEEYDAMDHGAVNARFAQDFAEAGGRPSLALDLGTGTAIIPVVLCERLPGIRIIAADYAAAMLRLARRNAQRGGLAHSIQLFRCDAKRLPFAADCFPQVISNSIVHHLPEPASVFREAWRVARPDGLIFFRDLFRPADESTLRLLVEQYAAGGTPRQEKMFGDSLRAALTVDEVREIVASLGSGSGSVTATSDRHWTWIARKGRN